MVTAVGALPPLAARVSSYRPSKVREIFARASAPGVISLAGGSPHVQSLPMAELAEQARDIVAEQGAVAFQYSFGCGLPALQRQIADLVALEGIEVDPDHVLVTAGSQLGLEALCKVVLDPGDVVIAEGPAYAGGLSALCSYGAEVRHVRTDAEGTDPDHLAELIDAAATRGKRVKMYYCMPTFQNPRNTVMSPERRERVARICEERGVLLLEDNAYGLLGFDGATHRAIKATHPDQVAYLGSFSKIFSPGLRLGYVIPPEPYVQALKDTIETFILNPPTFGQLQVLSYLTRSDWREHLVAARAMYSRRLDALLGALEATMPPEVTWRRPSGSFYLWVTLPDELDSEELMAEALARGVAFVPGTAFYTDGQGHHEARLSYCLPTEEELGRAGRILGELFSERLREARA